MFLSQILQPSRVRVPLEAKDKTTAITELIDVLDNENVFSSKDEALQAVLVREQMRSTGIGSGVAIPHGKCKAVRELVMAAGITREAIDFNSVDGKGVNIIMLLVSPIDKTGPHIQALAKISRMMLDESFRKKLMIATTSQEVCDLVRSKENE